MENIKLELQEAKKELENGAKRESDLSNIKTELENALQQANKELENVPECDLQKGKLSRWDVLYSCNFYNKTFTRKLQKKFRSNLHDIDDVSVVNIDQLITALRVVILVTRH